MSVGIDIGSKTVKIVELKKEGAGQRLVACGVVGYRGNVPSQIRDEKEFVVLADTIRKLHKEARVSSKEVSIALPESLVFTRTVRFPQLTDQEIISAVKWEAEQYIPIPIAEAIIEHQIIERETTGASAGVIVLLVASPRVLVEKYIKVIQMAGLKPVGVETELLSLVRALFSDNETALLLDFGATSTDIAIAKNGSLRFSRSIPTAGEALTRALAQGLGIEYQQAEEYKKTYGLSTELEGKVKAALDPVITVITDEIKKAIHFYQSDEKGDAPKSIIISGGSTGLPEIVSSLSRLLGLEVVVGNPFAKINVSPQVTKSIENYAPLYSIAVGLALRED